MLQPEKDVESHKKEEKPAAQEDATLVKMPQSEPKESALILKFKIMIVLYPCFYS